MGDVVHLHLHGVGAARLQVLGHFVSVAVGEVQQTVGHPARGSVRRQLAEAHVEQALRLVERHFQGEGRRPEDLQGVFERLAVEAERAGIVGELIRGLGGVSGAVARPRGGAEPGFRGASHAQGEGRAGLGSQPLRVQDVAPRLDAIRGPARLAYPAPGAEGMVAARRDAVLHPDPVGGLVQDSVVHVLQPAIPPPQGLVRISHHGAGRGLVHVLVSPGSDEALAGGREAREQARHRIGIGVGPAAHRVHRDLDVGVVLAHRAVLPEVVAGLVAQPLDDPRAVSLQAGEPHVAPAIADQCRVGGARVVPEHGEGPARIGVQQAAAHVVDVVRVAVVGEVHGDDALEGGRTPGRHLERVEAAPTLAEHADPAVAPGLGRDPRDDLERVVLLLLQVLVDEQAGGLAAAAHVDAKRRVAVPGEEGMHRLVAPRGAVAGAVGDVFEDRGHRMLGRVAGQPVAHREPGAVGERDEFALDLADLAGKGLDYRCLFRRHRFSSFVASFHGPASRRITARTLCQCPRAGYAHWHSEKANLRASWRPLARKSVRYCG